ncbi:MAG: protein kinase [Myxococcales bacterium]|nr:protein kinase [Myxococcales bacterium]
MTGDERDQRAPSTSPAEAATPERPPAQRRMLGRYQIIRRIGAGAMGVVFEAVDTERDERVALKTLHKLDPSALYRLKNEFRAVADVVHPNLVTLHELVSEKGQWFMTMEYIDGISFVEHVRRAPERSAPRARAALRQLARGLMALQAAGKLHRDVKSSNVLVDARGRVVLLDFGLAADSLVDSIDATVDEGILGTPAYMSPEQACGLPPTQASDWYAVGVILYESLTGELPYSGPTLKIIAEKQQAEPVAVTELAPETPQDLADLCMGLLARDPAARLDGAAILDRLDDLGGDAPQGDASVFVGREDLLGLLGDAYRASRSGAPVTVYVQGPSGIGKSAMVDHFLADLVRQDSSVVVLSGRCYERESVPYKAFDSLVDSLTRFLRRLPSVDAAVLMPRDIHALAKVFPVLERVQVVLEAPRRTFEAPDQLELRRRAFRGLREILAKIADRRPLVLTIGDMQWGDADSARLLADILAPPDPPALLIIGVYRNDEAQNSPMLGELKRLYSQSALRHDIRNLAVGPLSASESRALALSLLERSDLHALDQASMIARESAGSPLFVEELVRQARISAAYGPSDGTPLDISLEGVVRSRVRQLSPAARTLLEVLAIAGRPLLQDLVVRAAGIGEATVALTQLRALHMIRARGRHEETILECYHDRIRETVAASIPSNRQRTYHRALAEALEVAGESDAELIAHHYHHAGEESRAARYATLAADRAAAALAFNRAADLLRLARTWAPTGTPQSQELLIRHADALVHAGRCAEAAPLYLQAAESAPSAAGIELRRRAAEQYLVSGQIDAGVKILRPLLAAVSLSYPSTPSRANLSIIARSTQLGLRGTNFRERAAEAIDPADLRQVDVCLSASKGLNFVDPIRGFAFALRGLLLALQLGEPRRVARGLALTGLFMSSRSGEAGSTRGAVLVSEAEAIARRLDDPYLMGLASIADGLANVTLGRWRRALERLDGGVQILHDRCAGIAWESAVAQMGTMRSLLSMGRLRELQVRSQGWRREAEDAGDLYSEVWAALFWAYARVAAGKPEEARESVRSAIDRWSHQGFSFQHLLAIAVEVTCDLYQGRPMAAWNRIQAAWPAIESSHILSWVFLRIFSVHLRAGAALAAANANAQEAQRLLKAASGAADELERHSGSRRDGIATVLAIRAGIAALHGDRRQAIEHLEGAVAGFQSTDMQMHAACARRRLGECLGDEGQPLIDAADAFLRSQEIADPALWSSILIPGFAIERG